MRVRSEQKAISIGYHDVDDHEHSESYFLSQKTALHYKLSRSEFHDHLQSIRSEAPANPVSTINGLRLWARETPVFLTFDDGAISAYTLVADELEMHNWRGHFFITTDWIGQPGFLTAAQIRELHARGHVIGSHSCSHPSRMSHLTWDQLVREWSESRARLSDILGEQVKTASVADGYYSAKVGKAAAACGLEVLFTSEPTAATSLVDGCLILGRYSVQKHTPSAVSGAIAVGRRGCRWRQAAEWQVKKLVKALTGQSYLRIRRFIIESPCSKPRGHDRAKPG
jgi:peptidoglycan/xylan/chitin deacetylase (PgdA/CDA1 family)